MREWGVGVRVEVGGAGGGGGGGGWGEGHIPFTPKTLPNICQPDTPKVITCIGRIDSLTNFDPKVVIIICV